MIAPLLTDDMLGSIDPYPDAAAQWNERATALVETACLNSLYAMDPTTNLPSNADTLATMQRAALEQCQWWARAGVDPLAGVAGLSVFNIAKSSIGGASIEGNQSLANKQDNAKLKSLTSLVPEAVRILFLGGLADSNVQGWWT